MTWPLDPRSWWPGEEATALGTWLERWSEATTAWLDPSQSLQSPERLLFDIVEGISRRFRGKRLTLHRIGVAAAFVLDDIEMLRRRDSRDIELIASNVDWDGVPIEHVHVHASDVSVELGATSTLTAATVEVEGQADQSAALGWLGRFVENEWRVGLGDDGLIRARRPDGALVYSATAEARQSALVLELRRIEWRGLQVRLPRWLRLERATPLPALPRGLEVVSAALDDGVVRFRLRLAQLREPVKLDRLRKAVLSGLSDFSAPGDDVGASPADDFL